MAQTVHYIKTKDIKTVQWHLDASTGWVWKEDNPIFYKDEFQFYKQLSYAPYARRVRPSIPLLSPTSQRKTGWKVYLGLFDYSTKQYGITGRDGLQRYVVTNCCWKNSVYPALALDYCTTKFPVFVTGGEFTVKSNPEANQEAQTKCLLDLKDQVLNIAVSLAEAKTTVTWLAQRAQGVVKTLHGIKKGNWKDVREGVRMGVDNVRVLELKNGRLKTVKRNVSDQQRLKNLDRKAPAGWSTKDASDRYLEVHYAISPLISELAGAAVLLNKYFDDQGDPKYIIGKGKTSRAYYSEDVLTPWYLPPGPLGLVGSTPSCTVGFKSNVYHSVTALYLPKDEWRRALANAGVSSAALVQAGYEVLPWSFVLDWGVGFGDYLSALDADAGVDFVTGWDVAFCKGQMTPVAMQRGTALISLDSHGDPFGVLTAVTRSVRASPPGKFVTIKSPFSSSHITTAAALCRSLKSS